MKILVLNYEYPPLGGGAGWATKNVAENLAKNHQVWVLTTWYEGLEEVEVINNLRIYRVKSKRRFIYKSNVFEMLDWVRYAKSIAAELCRQIQIDIVIAHFTMPGGIVAKYLHKLFKIPYIVVSYGHDIPWFFPEQMFFYHLLLYYDIKSILEGASRIAVPHEKTKNYALQIVGKKHKNKIQIIPNGFSLEPSDRNFQNVDDGVLKIMFVGRLVMQKNPEVLVKCAKILREKQIPFQINIFGDGQLRNKLEKRIKRNSLEALVSIKGWQKKETVKSAYYTHHLFVLPSKAEAMSLALMDALASGIFCIVSKEAAENNLIKNGKNGFVIEKLTPHRLAKSIEDFYLKFKENPNFRTVPEKDFLDEYNWQSITYKYEKLISEVVQV